MVILMEKVMELEVDRSRMKPLLREQQEQGQMEVQVLEWIGEHVNTAQDDREARCWGAWRITGSGPW